MSDRVEAGVPETTDFQEGSLLWKVAKSAGALTLAGAWGAVMGASIGVQLPSSVELSEDITVSASLDLGGEGLRAGNGLAGLQDSSQSLDLGPISAGIQTSVERFDVKPEPESIASLASILENPRANIIEPMQDAITESAKLWATGAGATMIGLTGFVLLTRYMFKRQARRHAEELAKKEAENKALRAENTMLKEELGHETPKPNERTPVEAHGPQIRKRSHLAGAARLALYASGAAIFFSGPVAAQEINNAPPPAVKTAQPLNKQARDQAGLPETTQVVGTGAALINMGLSEAFKQIEIGDRSSREAGESLDTVFETFVKNNGLDYLANPDIQPILLLSDIHCNAPFIEHVLPRLIKYFSVRHILIAGDTMTNYGKFLDNGCYDSLLDKLHDTASELDIEIFVRESPGNHDSKEAMDIELHDQTGKERVDFARLTKENDYRSDDFGFSVVGSVNPTFSDFEGTQPEGLEAQDKVLAEQGKRTADAACKAMEDDLYGRPPLVMTHDIKEAIETMLRGCSFFIFNGHEHEDRGIQSYSSPTGRVFMQYTMGTSSGADGGFTQITRIKKPATATILKLNSATHTAEGFIKVVLHDDRDAEIFVKAPPTNTTPMLSSAFFAGFATERIYSQTANLTTAKLEQLGEGPPYKDRLRKYEEQYSRRSQATVQRRALSLHPRP